MDFDRFPFLSLISMDFSGFRRVLRGGGLTPDAGRYRRMAADGGGVVAPIRKIRNWMNQAWRLGGLVEA